MEEQTTEEEFIYLTHTAHRHISECLMDGFHIRVAVKGGGCSGLQYVLKLVEGPEENDKVISQNGLEVWSTE